MGVTGALFHYMAYPTPLCLDITANEPGFDSIINLWELLADFRMRGMSINVVILDPRIKTMKYNADDALVPWTSNASTLINAFGISLVIVHHEGKYKYEDQAKRGLDSIKYNAWFDVLMSLRANRDLEGKILGGTLEYTGKIPDSGKLNLLFNSVYCLWSLTEAEEAKHLSKKHKAKELILNMAALKLFEGEIKKAANAQGIAHTTFHNAMGELLQEGKIVSVPVDKNKRRIELSESGDIALSK